MHAQSCRFAGLGGVPKGLHAVLPHENSSVADVEEYTEIRDVVNHAHDRNQIREIPVSHCSEVSLEASEARIVEKANDGRQDPREEREVMVWRRLRASDDFPHRPAFFAVSRFGGSTSRRYDCAGKTAETAKIVEGESPVQPPCDQPPAPVPPPPLPPPPPEKPSAPFRGSAR